MSKPTVFAGAILALCVSAVSAQPTETPDEAAKKLTPYVYMRDAGGNKVFVESVFWRNDPNYDARSLKRMSDVMAAFEKLGFKGNPDAANGWDKAEKVVLPDQHGSGHRALARQERRDRQLREHRHFRDGSPRLEDPKHVSLILDAFNKQFKLAKEKLGR
jgi:hypothetical protein